MDKVKKYARFLMIMSGLGGLLYGFEKQMTQIVKKGLKKKGVEVVVGACGNDELKLNGPCIRCPSITFARGGNVIPDCARSTEQCAKTCWRHARTNFCECDRNRCVTRRKGCGTGFQC